MVRAGELLWWWGVAVGVWLLTLSAVTSAELVFALACGLPCAVAARAGRMAVGFRFRPRARWAWWPLPLAVAIAVDTVRVLLIPLRRPGRDEALGGLRELRLPAGDQDDVAAARRALVTLVVSATPGTFVVDSDPDRDALVVHSLVPGRSRIEEVVCR